MGVGINTAAALMGTLGVSAGKVSTASKGIGIGKDDSQNIAQSVDADRAEMAKMKAEYQLEKNKSIKLDNKYKRMRNRKFKESMNKEKQTLKKEDKPNG